MKRHKVVAGDLYAVPTESGTGYIQCGTVLNDGAVLIRVFPGLYQEPPILLDLCETKELAWYIFAASIYLHRKDIIFVGAFPAPRFPKMMIQQKLESGSYIVTLVDGTMHFADTTTVALTDAEAEELPAWGIPTCSYLRLSMHRLNGIEPPKTVETGKQAQDAVVHFLYFKKKKFARDALSELERAVSDISGEVDPAEGSRHFRLIVSDTQQPLNSERLSGALEEVASKHGGEYDGFEMPTDS